MAWDVKGNGRSVVRASVGLYYGAPEHAEPGRLRDRPTAFSSSASSWASTDLFPASARRCRPGLACSTPPPLPAGQFPLFSGVRVFDRDYKNPRIYAVERGLEQELAPDWSGYVDFTWARGDNLTRVPNSTDRTVCCDGPAATPFSRRRSSARSWCTPAAASRATAALTLGVRKRFSTGYQLEANYVLSKDKDNDSNERDPFTDRSFNFR